MTSDRRARARIFGFILLTAMMVAASQAAAFAATAVSPMGPGSIVTFIAGVPAGWSSIPVTFTLDAVGGIAPLDSFYRLSGASSSGVTTYTSPVGVTAEGTTTVEYWSVDASATRDATGFATILIDTSPPFTSSDATASYAGTATITLAPTDQYSGVANTFYKLDSGSVATYTAPIVVSAAGASTLEFWSVDNAGLRETTRTADFTVSAASARIAGADRYGTAIAASRSEFPTGSVSTVVIATGQDFPDALSAGPWRVRTAAPCFSRRQARSRRR